LHQTMHDAQRDIAPGQHQAAGGMIAKLR
jgi:hypothetical protein